MQNYPNIRRAIIHKRDFEYLCITGNKCICLIEKILNSQTTKGDINFQYGNIGKRKNLFFNRESQVTLLLQFTFIIFLSCYQSSLEEEKLKNKISLIVKILYIKLTNSFQLIKSLQTQIGINVDENFYLIFYEALKKRYEITDEELNNCDTDQVLNDIFNFDFHVLTPMAVFNLTQLKIQPETIRFINILKGFEILKQINPDFLKSVLSKFSALEEGKTEPIDQDPIEQQISSIRDNIRSLESDTDFIRNNYQFTEVLRIMNEKINDSNELFEQIKKDQTFVDEQQLELEKLNEEIDALEKEIRKPSINYEALN